MDKKKTSLSLIGYISNADNRLEKVGSVKLAASSEEWDELVAKHADMLKLQAEGRAQDWESWESLPGIRYPKDAVRKLMEKHYGEKFAMVEQSTSWPNRTIETWKATTRHLQERYMLVARSDGQVF